MSPAFALFQRVLPHLVPLAGGGVPNRLYATRRLGRAGINPFLLACLLLAVFLLMETRIAMAQEQVHVVARGDKLSLIALRYGVTVDALAEANALQNPNHIRVGQRLLVPGTSVQGSRNAGYISPAADAVVYTVRAGDTLSEIAQRFGMDLAELMRRNGLTDAGFVWVGQRLDVGNGGNSGWTASAGGVTAATAGRPGGASSVYTVRPGDTLSGIAARLDIPIEELMTANGLTDAGFVWVGQQLQLNTFAQSAAIVSATAPAGRRWIEINLTTQTLTAWQGEVPVLQTSISSGKPGTPTVTGRFRIGTKYPKQRMRGPGYDQPNVPWVMYFHGAYAIHGAYWHNSFGTPVSHGCVNTTVADAAFLYNWAPAGSEVWVYR